MTGPAIVGAAAITQRDGALGSLDLMRAVLEGAADDAGSRKLLDQIDWIGVPKGIWDHTDPGRALAPNARTSVLAEVGVLQQTLLTMACRAVDEGARVAVVVGGEDRARARAGLGADDPVAGGAPDFFLRPSGDILPRIEIERELAVPTHQYAVIESALRSAAGLTVADHAAHLAKRYDRLAEIAALNSWAWDPMPTNPDRPLAEPYTKRHVSQWNVDQAAAVIISRPETATSLGVPTDRCVFVQAAAEHNDMVPLTERGDLHRSPGTEHVLARTLSLGQVAIDDVADLELYSCFPAALELQVRALGLDDDRDLTLTGGMSFAGGPLNNFVVMAMERLVTTLRRDPGSVGLITSISGMVTKTGASLWSATPPDDSWAHDEVVAAAVPRAVDPDAAGDGPIRGFTVLHDRDGPSKVVAIVDVDGTRALAVSDRPTAQRASGADLLNRLATVADARLFLH